jgi:hypothetical protein
MIYGLAPTKGKAFAALDANPATRTQQEVRLKKRPQAVSGYVCWSFCRDTRVVYQTKLPLQDGEALIFSHQKYLRLAFQPA